MRKLTLTLLVLFLLPALAEANGIRMRAFAADAGTYGAGCYGCYGGQPLAATQCAPRTRFYSAPQCAPPVQTFAAPQCQSYEDVAPLTAPQQECVPPVQAYSAPQTYSAPLQAPMVYSASYSVPRRAVFASSYDNYAAPTAFLQVRTAPVFSNNILLVRQRHFGHVRVHARFRGGHHFGGRSRTVIRTRGFGAASVGFGFGF